MEIRERKALVGLKLIVSTYEYKQYVCVCVCVCVCVLYVSSPASVDEGADGFISSCATGVQVSPVPRLDQTHKVSTLSLKTHTQKTTVKTDIGHIDTVYMRPSVSSYLASYLVLIRVVR